MTGSISEAKVEDIFRIPIYQEYLHSTTETCLPEIPIVPSNLAFLISKKCGNGVLETAEVCDDGNLEAGDGCDGSCGLETVCF